ncbi:adenine phosphoribosyltransferase [Galbibacter sp.]|uniref:adenine phosphoribosyltransferase n=1 Tax=Galbibacter sp. TaxID=2918471 RepID=UPI002BB70160|nr:adenine phosphoribosyltransferase [Galbibacter sp.]HLV63466.1 adenine phosphoribosyltransferase [Galbibacter sp.]
MQELQTFIREVQDFPKSGVVFKDITPLLADHKMREQALKSLISLVPEKHIDVVVGVESRGFFFGTLLAAALKCSFVPVRKPGKLPFETLTQVYDLEYGQDSLQIHTDVIKKGDKVLIHDDVLATGGTAKAVCDLVEALGGDVVQCNFLLELSFLNGRDKLNGFNARAVVTY